MSPYDCAQGIESISPGDVGKNGPFTRFLISTSIQVVMVVVTLVANLVNVWDPSFEVGVSSVDSPRLSRFGSISIVTVRA